MLSNVFFLAVLSDKLTGPHHKRMTSSRSQSLYEEKLAINQNPWEAIWLGYKCAELV